MMKLLALDLDGTTLDDNQVTVSKKNREAISEAIKRGIIVVPTTGRAKKDLPFGVRQIKGMKYLIASNGASVTDRENGNVLYENLISPDSAAEIIDKLEPLNIYKEIFSRNDIFSQKDSTLRFVRNLNLLKFLYYLKKRTLVKSLPEFIINEKPPVEKIEVYASSKEEQLMLFKFLEGTDYPITTSGLNTVEVSNKGVNKKSALEHLCAILNIASEDVMAIGDNHNDKEMLEWAGLSVAVENAEPEVKQIADYITGPSNQNGVADAIHKFLLS